MANLTDKGMVATASTTIDAPISKVWDALTNPDVIKKFMFGTETVSDWKEGSPIVWRGTWKEKPYEDKGVILKIEPEQMLQYTHFSPLSGAEDLPENYHTLTYRLTKEDDKTAVSLSQDKNSSEEELREAQTMWEMMLASLKKVLEA